MRTIRSVYEELEAAAVCGLPPEGYPHKRYEERLRKAIDAALEELDRYKRLSGDHNEESEE